MEEKHKILKYGKCCTLNIKLEDRVVYNAWLGTPTLPAFLIEMVQSSLIKIYKFSVYNS